MRLFQSLSMKGFSREQKKFIGLSSLSSGLEYYDFILFVIFAKAISNSFFKGPAWLALLATFAIFAVGYFSRPLGALIFGHYGDRFGRKKSFVATAILMAISSLLIGLLPGYATWGILAPICLVVLRLLQGLSLGGELAGSLVYSIEIAPKAHRAFTVALIFLGVNSGILLAYLISDVIQFHAWTWRIAFVVGGGLGILNFYLRRVLHESPIFTAQSSRDIAALPVLILLKTHFKKVLQGVGLVMMGSIAITIVFYMPTYLFVYYHIPFAKVLLLNTLNLIILSIEQIVLGLLSDRYGRKPILLSCAILYLFLSYPLFKILALGNIGVVMGVLIIFVLLNGLAASAYPTMLAELFPTQIRYSGFALSYNIAFALFAGLTPFLLTYFIHLTGSLAFPGIYLTLLAILALIAIVSVPETYQKNLLLDKI